MHFVLQPWQFFFVILVGWVNREQQEIMEFYQTQLDAVMKAPGKKRLPLTDDQRRLLAIKGKSLGRKGKRRIAGGSCGITTHLDARVLPRAAFLDILSGKSLTAKSLAPEPPGDQKMLNQHRLARQHDVAIQPRREFLKQAGALALATSTVPLLSDELAAAADSKPPETLVKMLYDTLKENQRKEVCFEWNHIDKNRGLLRTRLENNWTITKPSIKSGFFSSDQQAMIRKIFEGMTHPGWHERWDEQLKGDVGGFGNNQSIAIFGKPGTDQFEFVLASRHMTLRCDGNSAEHVAFGGPILYAHDGEATFEKPTHPSNVFWHQAVAANKLYDMFDGNQREKALVINGMPSEELVGFRGPNGKFDGIAVTDFSPDQKEHLQSVLKLLLEPFRQSDRDEVTRCLKVQGGLDACRLAFYKEGDLGKDGIWDNWRLEGPSFVWYFRGKPHVHVWVNVADTPDIKLNSYQDSVGV